MVLSGEQRHIVISLAFDLEMWREKRVCEY